MPIAIMKIDFPASVAGDDDTLAQGETQLYTSRNMEKPAAPLVSLWSVGCCNDPGFWCAKASACMHARKLYHRAASWPAPDVRLQSVDRAPEGIIDDMHADPADGRGSRGTVQSSLLQYVVQALHA
jgi:hypothetical protein